MSPARARWRPAYVGLGSNLEDPVGQVEGALAELAALPQTRLEARSSLYRSAPLGPADQPDYVNAAAALLTRLTADELLAGLQAIEASHGRRRDGARWGPRTLDLDLLVYGRERRESASLTLPHPRIAQRNFVLWPLAEIAPYLTVPGLTHVAALTAALGTDAPGIVRLGP
ncbi:MAG: 2-amino-4-hydroxy-6-hydroxymethyldihydropteridine diphosphokinase [Woeseiaceae bacterium]|nr:2-amino-4-hydroxy-6-hydroxymethyldihydropteridine diphosphokinase [Woeseiaceae bacterium]